MTHIPSVDIASSELGPSTQNINQENAPKGLPTIQFNGDIFSVRMTYSQMSLGLCQVEKI